MTREVPRIYRPLHLDSIEAINTELEIFADIYDFVHPVYLPDNEFKFTAISGRTNQQLVSKVGQNALIQALSSDDNKSENPIFTSISRYNLRKPGYGDSIYVLYAKDHGYKFEEIDKIGLSLELEHFIPESISELYATNNVEIFPKSPGGFNLGCIPTNIEPEIRDNALVDLEWRLKNRIEKTELGPLFFDTPRDQDRRLTQGHAATNRRR